MTRYTVNECDASADGMERLRNQDEFILISGATADSHDPRAIFEGFLEDIQSCARPDEFDYDACEKALHDWFDESGASDIKDALRYIDWREIDEFEGVTVRLYVATETE